MEKYVLSNCRICKQRTGENSREVFEKYKKKNMSRTKKRFLDVKIADISNKFGKSQASTFKVFLVLFVSHIAEPPRAA